MCKVGNKNLSRVRALCLTICQPILGSRSSNRQPKARTVEDEGQHLALNATIKTHRRTNMPSNQEEVQMPIEHLPAAPGIHELYDFQQEGLVVPLASVWHRSLSPCRCQLKMVHL